jgi:curved DNA-binding protein CbpA
MAGMTSPEAETLYGVLGVNPGASAEEVERAYRFCRDLYGDECVATYSLLDPDDMRGARQRVEEAWQVLGDPQRRHAYDVSHGLVSAGAPIPIMPAREESPASLSAPTTTWPASVRLEPVPPPPVNVTREPPPPVAPVVLAEPVTGPALRRFREQVGVSLREIATRSKVGVRYLEYIEQDRHRDLPAPVYLRGFLQEYARAVGLDPRRTAEDYLARITRSD